MADNTRNAGDAPEVALDLDDQTTDLEAAMRDAVAAVEGVESGNRGGDAPAASDPGRRTKVGQATAASSEPALAIARLFARTSVNRTITTTSFVLVSLTSRQSETAGAALSAPQRDRSDSP